jgi:hypothetical protein
MDDNEEGACFSVYLGRTLTAEEKSILNEFESYLQQYKIRYSFIHSFKIPSFTKYEKGQLLQIMGFIPEEELYICGLATPLFRSIEAILKYYGGYAEIGPGYDETVKGNFHKIRKTQIYFNHFYPVSYYLSDWEIIANVYNQDDPPEIRRIYSIPNFLKIKNL